MVIPNDDLKRLRFEFKDLGTASMMKDSLRNIYKLADSYELARTAFLLWSKKAEASGIHCLKQMAKTIRRLDGLLACWKHAKLTRASQEGFNNKIGWLVGLWLSRRETATPKDPRPTESIDEKKPLKNAHPVKSRKNEKNQRLRILLMMELATGGQPETKSLPFL